MTDTPRVAIVTGASRGAGKGIALALGEAGMTVYVTGRSTESPTGDLPGTITATAAEVTARGGRGIAVAVDHSSDESVAALVEQVRAEHGYVDVLVNNVFAAPDGLVTPLPFWEQSLDMDQMFDIGLRSTYVMTALAAPLLIADPSRRGLVVNTSGFGGTCFMHGPAYGAVKAGVDKMAHDFAVDLKPHGVTAVSIWMGLLRTERTTRVLAAEPDKYRGVDQTTESPEFPGRVIVALDAHADKERFTGRVLVAAELAGVLGVTDVDGRQPASRRPLLGDPPRFSDAVVR